MSFNIREISIDAVREMICQGDDNHDNQIRVDIDGRVYLSQDVVGAMNIENVLFRFDSFDAKGDYVGENAANDNQYIKKIYLALKSNWPNPKSSYIEDWNVDGAY